MTRDDATQGDVTIWLLSPASLDAAQQEGLASSLSLEERDRCCLLRRDEDREQFRTAHGLLRRLLARELDVDAEEIRFVTNAYGRPSLAQAGSSLSFNLSHADGLIAVALSRGGEVGVDVEAIDRSIDVLEIADATFSASERAQVLGQGGERERRERLFQLWTLKEAYVKARGMGVSLELRSFSFDLTSELRFEPPPDDLRRWQFFMARPSPRHMLAACVEATHSEVGLRFTIQDARSALDEPR